MPIARKTEVQKNRDDEERRKELADFLKTRRARVKPPANGYFQLSRRRTPGLRREEVAEMTGVSAAWYTWLEQGRDIHPSSELLSRLGEVLHLNQFEISHLFDLAGRTPVDENPFTPEEVPETLRLFVTEMINVPAMVIGERYDFLIWNDAFTKQLFDLDTLPKERRNLLDMMFMKDSHFRDFPDWNELARRTVAEFRWSVAKHLGRPWLKELVTRMCKESAEFAQLWQLHDIQEQKNSRILEAVTEKKGKELFIRSIYIPAEAEHLRVIVMAPLKSEPTKEKKKKVTRQ
jgi:transcriptional regulator with XRE-family HTH domain